MKKDFLSVVFVLTMLSCAACAKNDTAMPAAGSIDRGAGQVIGVQKTESADLADKQDPQDDKTEDTGHVFENAGNIMNSGIVCERGEWIYYINKNENSRLYRTSTDGVTETVGNIYGAIDLNVLEDCVIYQSSGICRYDFADGAVTKIVEGTCRNVMVYGDRIYYLKMDSDTYKIYSAGLEGSGETQLCGSISSYLNISGDQLYYIDGTDEGHIHRMNPDGTNNVQLSSFGSVEEMVLSDGVIYYISSSASGCRLWKMNIDGTGDTRIYDGECHSINVSDDTIYFRDQQTQSLCSVNTDGTGYCVYVERACSDINLTDEWIYYFDIDEMNYYRVRRDGADGYQPALVE